MYIPLTIPLEPLFALIAGILILVIPRLLNYIVALYLIIIGLYGLLPPHRVEHTAAAVMERPAP
jgi:DUF3096 family protein